MKIPTYNRRFARAAWRTTFAKGMFRFRPRVRWAVARLFLSENPAFKK